MSYIISNGFFSSEDSFPRPFPRSIPFRLFLPKVLIAVPVVVAAFFPFMAPPKKKRKRKSILKLKRLP
jgi:hypothetical protein